MGFGLVSTSLANLPGFPIDPARLTTPKPDLRHQLCHQSDHCLEPGVGQIPKASSIFHKVLRELEQRLERCAACASEGILVGHVDLPLRPWVMNPRQGQPLPRANNEECTEKKQDWFRPMHRLYAPNSTSSRQNIMSPNQRLTSFRPSKAKTERQVSEVDWNSPSRNSPSRRGCDSGSTSRRETPQVDSKLNLFRRGPRASIGDTTAEGL